MRRVMTLLSESITGDSLNGDFFHFFHKRLDVSFVCVGV